MLTVIVQQMAEGPLNRNKAVGTAYNTDANYEKIALELMKKINERVAETDNPSPRGALAIAMLVMASQGTIADLTDKLIETLPDADARDMARSEWLPSALGTDGRVQSFDSILASADAGHRPDLDFVLVIAGPQYHDSVLQDLFGWSANLDGTSNTRTPVLDAVQNPLGQATPIIGAGPGGDVKAAAGDVNQNISGDVPTGSDDRPSAPNGNDPKKPEPGPYQWQNMY